MPPPTVPAPLPESALEHADLMRGIAALTVLIGHVRGFGFVDWPGIARPNVVLRALYAVTGLGHQCVVVFFVLSGFFIGHSVLRTRATGTWSWKGFMLNRFTRLYVVLIPALVLTAAIDLAGMSIFGASHNTYTGDLDAPFMSRIDVRQTIGVGTFVGNLAFLQSFTCKPYGSNGPLWSLSYEFWCYVVFPLFVQALGRATRWWLRVVSVALASVVFFVGGESMFLYFGIWLVGAAVAGLWATTRPASGALRTASVAGALAFFFAALGAARVDVLHGEQRGDALLGVATGALLLALLWHGAPSRGGAYGRFAKWLAGFSYTTYLVHMPVVVLLNVAFVGIHRWQPDALHVAYAAAAFVGIVALFVYPLSRVTEAHTARVRKWVAARLGIAPAGG